MTLDTLNEDPNQLTEFELNSVISLLGPTLNNFMNISPSNYPSISGRFQKRVVNTLKKITERLVVYQDRIDRTPPLLQRISEIEEMFKTLSLRESPPIKIGLKIGVFCDLDCNDHNGAVLRLIQDAFISKLPFITTRSLMCGAELDDPKHEWSYLLVSALEHIIVNSLDQWDVYQQFHQDREGEYLVFLPKALCPDKEGLEKLHALDFVADGISLKQTSINNIFQPTKEKGTLEGLFQLFSSSPTLEKVFYLGGHGNHDMVVSFESKHYLELLDFLKFQKCRGVMIASCFAGGESSLLTIGCDSATASKSSQSIPGSSRPYVMVIRSIGGLSATSDGQTENDINTNMQGFVEFIENGTATVSSFRKRVNKIEGSKFKIPNISMQICFPHQGGVPVGFRPVGEGLYAYAITYNLVKQKELESKQIFRQGVESAHSVVTIEYEKLICLHPMVVNLHLHIICKNAILLSMIP
jgi:hypothetical protein